MNGCKRKGGKREEKGRKKIRAREKVKKSSETLVWVLGLRMVEK
jgi:hypothetical protein